MQGVTRNLAVKGRQAITSITGLARQNGCQNIQKKSFNVQMESINIPPAVFTTRNLPNQLFFARFESSTAERLQEHGFESTTISDILKQKGDKADGHWLFCKTEDSVYEAVKSMTQHNVGALLVVKPGGHDIAGIVTERDYLRKIIVQGRSSKTTKVGDIMTEENKLITVTPETKVLQAMELMTEKRIRHIPVIKGGEMRGMVSIGDVVRAVVDEHREELERLNAYIQGGY